MARCGQYQRSIVHGSKYQCVVARQQILIIIIFVFCGVKTVCQQGRSTAAEFCVGDNVVEGCENDDKAEQRKYTSAQTNQLHDIYY